MSSAPASDRGGDTAPAPPRLTLSELVRLQLQALARSGGEHSTVELTLNARGDTQITVKVRTGDAGVDTPDDALAKARELYEAARAAYPRAGNGS